MYRWARRSGLQPADAANIQQETLRAVAEYLPEFQAEGPSSSFRGWLRRICQNKIRDHFRGQNRRPDRPWGDKDGRSLVEDLSEEGTVSRTGPVLPPKGFDAAVVEKFRKSVSERDWQIFWRIVVDGQAPRDVAQEQGLTANTVRIVKTRLLRKLRELLTAPAAEPEGSDNVRN